MKKKMEVIVLVHQVYHTKIVDLLIVKLAIEESLASFYRFRVHCAYGTTSCTYCLLLY
jgi:hypothetical protein